MEAVDLGPALNQFTPEDIKASIQNIASKVTPRKLESETIGEMFANPPEPAKWLVEYWWWVGATGFISGPSKIGKSFFTTDFALSVCSGTPFLGKYPVVTQGPVLLVQNENGRATVYDRLRKICHARGISEKEIKDLPLHMCNNQSVMLDNELDIGLLEDKIKNINPVLIQLDPLYMMIKGSPSDDGYMIPILQEITELRNRTGVAIQIVTHNRKSSSNNSDAGDNVNGTMFQRANHQCAWYLKRTKTSSTVPEEVLKNDDEEIIEIPNRPIEFTIEREFRDGGKPYDRDLIITLGQPGELGYSVEDMTSGKREAIAQKNIDAEHKQKLIKAIVDLVEREEMITPTAIKESIRDFKQRDIIPCVMEISVPSDNHRLLERMDNPKGKGMVVKKYTPPFKNNTEL